MVSGDKHKQRQALGRRLPSLASGGQGGGGHGQSYAARMGLARALRKKKMARDRTYPCAARASGGTASGRASGATTPQNNGACHSEAAGWHWEWTTRYSPHGAVDQPTAGGRSPNPPLVSERGGGGVAPSQFRGASENRHCNSDGKLRGPSRLLRNPIQLMH